MRRLLLLFGLVWCTLASWAIASPALEGPDERDHAVRAVATARGQLVGDFESTNSPFGDVMYVRVPRALCPLLVDVPDKCGSTSDPDVASVETNEYRHPPPYYVAVGLPTLVSQSRTVGYAMRLVGVTLASALLATAWTAALGARRRIVMLGPLASCTPVAWFLMSQVNPNGFEVAASVAVGTTSVAVVRGVSPLPKWAWGAGVA